MMRPFAVPSHLSPDLTRVHAWWKGLLRGGAEMPFADDVNLTDLPDLAGRLILLDVFERPERFRASQVGDALGQADLAGHFLDEASLAPPLDYLRAQCSATVEAAAPSWFKADGPARLLLPFWGEGRVSLLLGVIDPG